MVRIYVRTYFTVLMQMVTAVGRHWCSTPAAATARLLRGANGPVSCSPSSLITV